MRLEHHGEAFDAHFTLTDAYAGFDGHFPGQPVLPGMCQVDLAVRAVREALDQPSLALVQVAAARFVRPVRPPALLVVAVTCELTPRGVRVRTLHKCGDLEVGSADFLLA